MPTGHLIKWTPPQHMEPHRYKSLDSHLLQLMKSSTNFCLSSSISAVKHLWKREVLGMMKQKVTFKIAHCPCHAHQLPNALVAPIFLVQLVVLDWFSFFVLFYFWRTNGNANSENRHIKAIREPEFRGTVELREQHLHLLKTILQTMLVTA